jgi:PPOX class probable F420-dependent enzyme
VSSDAVMTDEDRSLLRDLNFAHVVTLNPDGSPHVAPTWIDADDAGHVLINSAVGRKKDRNVRRDPRVAVSVHVQDDPYTWIAINGTVVSIETGDEAEGHIDALNQRYHDGERWTPRPGQVRVIYRVRPDRIVRGSE